MPRRSDVPGLLLALWSRLALIFATTGLFCLLIYTLQAVDSWLFYESAADVITDSAARVLAILAAAAVLAIAGTLLALMLSGIDRVRLQPIGTKILGIAVLVSLVLCSLLLWRAIFTWAAVVKLITVPFALKYSLWLAVVVIALVLLMRRQTQSSKDMEMAFAGKASRRTVLAGALGALLVLAARPILSTRAFVKPSVEAAARQRPNILLVTFDAMSAEDMSLYGYRLPTTPNIDAFARSSSVFTNFYSCSTFTTSSVASILTGRYPLNTRVFHPWGRLRGEDAEKTLSRELRAAGYQTAASAGNVLVYPPRLGVEFDLVATPPVKGVMAVPPVLMDDSLYLQADIRRTLEYRWPALFGTTESRFPPEASFEQAETLLRGLTPPFFLWVHVMAPHFPYQPSPPFLNRFVQGGDMRTMSEIGPVLDLNGGRYSARSQPMIDRWRLRYDEWMTQADAAFGQFLSRLESTRVLDSTVFIVSSDHGESFEGGVWSHNSRTQLRQMIHVPLIVRLPGQTEGRRIAMVADETAIAPTILEMAGVATPEWMDGQSLMPWIGGNAADAASGIAFTQYFEKDSVFKPVSHGTVGAINGTHQYVIDLESGKGALYELADANVQDNDLASKEPGIAAAMRELILARFPELRRAAA